MLNFRNPKSEILEEVFAIPEVQLYKLNDFIFSHINASVPFLPIR